MKESSAISLYKKYYVENNNENLGQFIILAEKYYVKSALYPGSFVHITPSFIFPIVTYIDTDKRAKAFFNDSSIYDYVFKHRMYESTPVVSYYPEDYRNSTLEPQDGFDLLVSLYAGFVSQYCKKYLKVDGLLLVNNSHGDASMASIDESYQLEGVLNRRGSKFNLSYKHLNSYFIPKKVIRITKEYLKKTGRGIGYTKSPTSYLFKRIK